jgi:hypothetical protein
MARFQINICHSLKAENRTPQFQRSSDQSETGKIAIHIFDIFAFRALKAAQWSMESQFI